MRARVATVVAGAILISAFFFLVEGTSVDARTAAAIPLMIWWMTPYAIYFAVVRTAFGVRLIGLFLVVATFAFLMALYTQDDAQAALGS